MENTLDSDSDGDAHAPRVFIKPRPFVRVDNEQDFFVRKPRMSLENWEDMLKALEVRFDDPANVWTPKEQRRDARRSLRDIEKFRNDIRFPQEILDQWEEKLSNILKQAEKV